MKFLPRTVQILKNFSTINQSILFKQGNALSTVSPQKTILAKANVKENFDREFAIYDLPKFLGVMSLFNEPEVTTDEKFAVIKDGNQKVHYTYTDPKMIVTPPNKNVDMGDTSVKFKLTNDTLARIIKAMSVLQTPEIAVVGNEGTIFIETCDSKNKTSDNFSVIVGDSTEHTFKMVFKVDNIKMLAGDYDVEISKKGIGHFKSDDVEYWITVESSASSFN